MKIALGNDHRGFEAKQLIKSIVTQLGHECIDVGTNDTNPVDYPDSAYLAATAVSNNQADRAILVCSTGLGMSIAANKIKGIRAALCHDELGARISRDHNNANVLCVSGDQTGEVLLRKIVEVWLNTEFSGGRHERRVRKIAAIEEGKDPRFIDNETKKESV
jgi:ribose 5-phosphate isomerase B